MHEAASGPLTVMKFGGTSVATAPALEALGQIVASVEGRRVVVVSATAGTTDALIAAARAAEAGRSDVAIDGVHALADRHEVLAEVLGDRAGTVQPELDALAERTEALLRSVAILRECTARTLDAIVSYGERASAPIVAAALVARGIEARAISAEALIVTDETFGDADPLMAPTQGLARRGLMPVLDAGVVAVVTGFLGATEDGVTTTLGRGGSDYSAAILAAVLGASDLRIYTDVSGVMSADPRVVSDAATLASLSYAEAAELSYFGAKVLHPRTVLPAVEAGIPVRILNTFAPADAGTTITAVANQDGSIVKATTSLGGLGLVTVSGSGMSGVPGFAAQVFDTTAEQRVSVLMISQSSSEQAICLVVAADECERLRVALERALTRAFARHDVDRVAVEAPVAIVAAVGEGMRGTPGVSGRLFGALGRARVNVIAIAQGSSERNISLVVSEADRAAAVRAIHEEFHAAGG